MDKKELEERLPAFVGQAFGPPEVGLDPVNAPMIRFPVVNSIRL